MRYLVVAFQKQRNAGGFKMPRIFTPDTVSMRAKERGLRPGDRLWAAGEKIEGDAFRLGNSDKNPATYLRWRDLGVAKTGKIETDHDQRSQTVSPGQGLSLFIERVVHADFNYIETRQQQTGKGALRQLAQEKGYSEVRQIHWFKLAEGKSMPAGLEVVFNNEPPGHCMLTVTHTMTVKDFLGMVETHLDFQYVGTDLFGTA